MIYEKNINGKLFVNTHGSEIMTSLLVVVNKKMIEKFQTTYPTCFSEFKQNDFESWQQRTLANIQARNQNVDDETQRVAIIDQEFKAAKEEYEKQLPLPGVVPNSAKFLNEEDGEGNQLWRVTVMKDSASDYMRILKKNGFTG